MAYKVNTSRLADGIARKLSVEPIFVLASALLLNEEHARVVGKFTRIPKDANQARVAIAKAFNQNVSAVPESFTVIKKGESQIEVSGFVQLNRETRVVDDKAISAETARYREMAANLYMDNEDESLWKLTVAESGSKSLSRIANSELNQLISLAATANRDRHATHIEDVLPLLDLQPSPRNAVYASFFSSETEQVNYGYVVTANTMFNTDTMKVEEVKREQLISYTLLAGQDQLSTVAAPADDAAAETQLDYYRELCTTNPDFYMNLDNLFSAETVA